MTRRTYFTGITALCATVLISAGLLAQQEGYQQHEMSPEEQAMMAAWQEYATPGPQHERLTDKVGTWAVQGKMWHGPGGPAEAFDGKATYKAVMGGRYIIEKFHGSEFMGIPFQGMGIAGYDNLTDTFVGAWIDNFGTGILRSEGTLSGDGTTVHTTFDHPDLMNGTYTKARIVEEKINKDKFVATFFIPGPDGTEYKHLELTYMRAAEKQHAGEKTKDKEKKSRGY